MERFIELTVLEQIMKEIRSDLRIRTKNRAMDELEYQLQSKFIRAKKAEEKRQNSIVEKKFSDFWGEITKR